jgi:2-methylcitrate dehydratase PrpD
VTISQILAEHVAGTAFDALPPDAVRAAKASLIDTLAVSVAARGAPGVQQVIDLAISDGGRGASALWTWSARVPPRAAAFANAFTASALDFDSLHQESVGHADIVIVPTAVAVAEDRGVTGKELLTAIALGDDLLCRLCRSTRGNTGWFYTTLYGPIASAAVAAKLLGGESRRIAAAMGLASMSASGTQQPAVERSTGKRMQGALAASAGVTAGYLGAAGIDGPLEIVEGRFGLHEMHEKGDVSAIMENLGARYENTRIGYKLYPSCQCNHAAIEGMLTLRRRHDLSASNVRSVEVSVSPYMQRLVGAPFDPTGNPQVAAQFSVQYSIAAVLLNGRFHVGEISDDAVLDPRIRELVRRISTIIDAHNTNKYAPVRLKVTTTDGRTLEHEVTTFRGAEDLPLTDGDLKEKLAMCIEASGASAAAATANMAFDAVMSLESTRNVTTFVSGLLARCLSS